jgi:hypothetical protein
MDVRYLWQSEILKCCSRKGSYHDGASYMKARTLNALVIGICMALGLELHSSVTTSSIKVPDLILKV